MKHWIIGCLLLTLTACAEGQLGAQLSKRLYGSTEGSKPHYKVGEPYTINGVTYYPEENFDYSANGMASWYGKAFHGRTTANGEVFDREQLTAAHPTLQLPSIARITNLENNRSVVVRINDRGPFRKNRLIDLSERTADVLGFREKGEAYVNVTILSEPSMELKNALLNNGKQDPNAIDAPSQRVDNVRTSGIKAAALDSKDLAKGVDPDNPPPLDISVDNSQGGESGKSRPALLAPLPPPSSLIPLNPASAKSKNVATASKANKPATTAVGKNAAVASPKSASPTLAAKGATTAAAVGQKTGFVQVGSFKSASVAARVSDSVKAAAPASAKVQVRTVAGSSKVQVGPLKPTQLAELLTKVKALGFKQATVVYVE
ncbi:MAG: septal ring lytic transglycosylase RlpA family protein [Alphaproteobacteria bacterium]|nr:septal ring lytic transglycosylase RlpA family protein [Alphaproteobacteria bacterium]